MSKVIIYSDGHSLSNPGKSGYGAILKWNKSEKEISQGYHLSTNNRMELMGAIATLEMLKRPVEVDFYTDSIYIINGMTKWVPKWKKRDWMDSKKKPVKNNDLWRRLDKASTIHKVTWNHVKTHSGAALNERCNRIAIEAAKSNKKKHDTKYENTKN
jgi:ribonuclease HI